MCMEEETVWPRPRPLANVEAEPTPPEVIDAVAETCLYDQDIEDEIYAFHLALDEETFFNGP